MLAALLVIGVATGAYAVSTEGPGSKHAPIILSLVVALVIGALAQKSRMCFAGSIRDLILMKNFDLISIIAALFAVMAVYNVAQLAAFTSVLPVSRSRILSTCGTFLVCML